MQNKQVTQQIKSKTFLPVKTTTEDKIQPEDKYLQTGGKNWYHLLYKELIQNSTGTFYSLQRKMDKGHGQTRKDSLKIHIQKNTQNT